jgi:hypothetical protein
MCQSGGVLPLPVYLYLYRAQRMHPGTLPLMLLAQASAVSSNVFPAPCFDEVYNAHLVPYHYLFCAIANVKDVQDAE